MVTIILVLNTLVFFGWIFLLKDERSAQFMIDNFLLSFTNFITGRYWTVITTVFSQNLFWHFLLNMFVLNNFGRIIEVILGSRRFILFYLAAGIISSLGHILVSAYILHQPDLSALGASGAISGIVVLFCMMFPREKILILGFIPIRALWGAILFMALDVWGLVAQSSGGGLPIGHGAHLGGALTGIIYYLMIRSKRETIAPSL